MIVKILHSLSKYIVTPFSAVYGSAGSTPSTLGLPVLMKFIHAEPMMEAIAHASELPVQSGLKSTVLNAKGISNPWKDPLMRHPQGFSMLRNRHTKGCLFHALASAVSMV